MGFVEQVFLEVGHLFSVALKYYNYSNSAKTTKPLIMLVRQKLKQQ